MDAYESRSGATTVKRVVCAFPGDEARVSSKTMVREERYAFVDRPQERAASGRRAGSANVSVRPSTVTRSGRRRRRVRDNSPRRNSPPPPVDLHRAAARGGAVGVEQRHGCGPRRSCDADGERAELARVDDGVRAAAARSAARDRDRDRRGVTRAAATPGSSSVRTATATTIDRAQSSRRAPSCAVARTSRAAGCGSASRPRAAGRRARSSTISARP